ncbi:MAG: hypothetical protein JRI25_20495, partial [Deltaproteobacteria bacterium]|nr:hypothetical protein [Deltaproteobacteria bacterium]
MPPVLLAQSVQRLRGLSLVVSIVFASIWLFKNAIEGRLLAEFEHPWEWGPPVLIILASAAMYGFVRGARVPATTLATLGLVYEVVVSFGLEAATHGLAFHGLEAHHLSFDRVGFSMAGLWMVLFTILVPNRPRAVLIALVAAGSAPSILYALSARLGVAPSLEPVPFFVIFILPYLMCAGAAYFAAVVIYRLGQDLRRAREMGSYRLDTLLGQGGMGEVWHARHRMLARPAAVKLIRPDALGSDPAAVDTAVRRFEQEAQITAGLQSPHTVELYDFGVSEEGTLYYVMELLDGIDLESMVRKWGP